MVDTPHAPLDGSRVRLKPLLSVTGFVDGAWWPRSTDLTAEVPELAAALAERIGPVWRVAFPSAAWTVTGTRMVNRGMIIRLEGFRAQDPHIVHVTGSLMRRLTLLVVPAGTTQVIVERAMSAASDQNDATRPEALLDGAGLAHPPAENDVYRWESEGGSTAAIAAVSRP
ncbi:DUF5994 family protein [Amycolatopsis carbonis]|uniref:DUF5994 family protein n=1 Tax=Amycolatopsis carbonis TaxID=715471 RepID=A0A9Y2IQS1_9PSEU|nr:DUF5994 family protein [Amycolatopsis sp. 2-15]WIX82798.1 DUF5994 family protein [Amycolatopsis sp. 2-15]